jgi:ring-1,2-phenylacetyl-CoA epoxidase subunit PaaC
MMGAANKSDLFEYALRLGDSCLVLGHRLAEWCGHAPNIELDIATTNVALDLTGQAALLLAYAGEVEGRGRDEDALAYLRDGIEYRNFLLAEQPNGDFGRTIARQFLFDAWHVELMRALSSSTDERLAGIAAKTAKEAAYHLRHSTDWLTRLGDGTEESHARVQAALDELWSYTGELFEVDDVQTRLQVAGVAPDMAPVRARWSATVEHVLADATLARPADGWMRGGGLVGRHGEALGHMLAVMQHLPRAHPGARW